MLKASLHRLVKVMVLNMVIGMVGIVPTAFAEQPDQSERLIKISPQARGEIQQEQPQAVQKAPKVKAPKAAIEQFPTTVYADNLTFDDKTGNIQATGNVKVVRGDDVVTTEKLDGNYKTNDIWLHDGGNLKNLTSNLNAKSGEYNYTDKTGILYKVDGKVDKEYIRSEQVDIYPDRYQGHTTSITRCPAQNPDFYAQADRVDIYPGQKLIAYNMRLFIKGKHIYTQNRYVQDITPGEKDTLFPTIRYDNKDGLEIQKEFTHFLGTDTTAFFDFDLYTDSGFRPYGGLRQDTSNYKVEVGVGHRRDADKNWIRKEPEFSFAYKTRKLGQTRLNYNFYGVHGKWLDAHKTSWHSDIGVNVYREPIYLSKDKSLYLSLGTGYQVLWESYDNSRRDIFRANGVLGKSFGNRLNAWVGYYYTSDINSLFDFGEPDMSRELQTGVRYVLTKRDSLKVVHRYDTKNKYTYDFDVSWIHNMHCMEIEFEYREKRNEFNVYWRLLNW